MYKTLQKVLNKPLSQLLSESVEYKCIVLINNYLHKKNYSDNPMQGIGYPFA